jgi:hypothetical protein
LGLAVLFVEPVVVSEEKEDLSEVVDAAIGKFCRLLTLGDVELLAGVRFAHEVGGFTSHGSFDGRGRGGIRLAEE